MYITYIRYAHAYKQTLWGEGFFSSFCSRPPDTYIHEHTHTCCSSGRVAVCKVAVNDLPAVIKLFVESGKKS